MRDNGRIALNDEGYAQHLWQVLGLQPALAAIAMDGAGACGLNPDIRIYRSKFKPVLTAMPIAPSVLVHACIHAPNVLPYGD